MQFFILSGRQAGTSWSARRLPFQIGRDASCALRLEDDGVWDRHLEISLRRPNGVVLRVPSDAYATVNGQAVRECALRNGDVVELGAVRMRFGFRPTRQRGLAFREGLTWIALALLFGAQVALIYLLLAAAS